MTNNFFSIIRGQINEERWANYVQKLINDPAEREEIHKKPFSVFTTKLLKPDHPDDQNRPGAIGFTQPDGRTHSLPGDNGDTDAIETVEVIQLRENVLTIILPTKTQMHFATEDVKKSGVPYGLPEIYQLAFIGKPGEEDGIDELTRIKILKARVGAYCIGQCM